MLQMEDENQIKAGHIVIVQRQKYTKLHKVKPHGSCVLGHFKIELDNIIGERYFETFRMKNVPGVSNCYTLEKVKHTINATSDVNIESSGADNRNITVDGEIQALSKEDIDKLKDEKFSSQNIVGELINNSKTFGLKTEYSQEKYIRKKEKKYFEYVQIRKPTIRLLANLFYRNGPHKTMGIRIDDLSQMLVHANILSTGNHLLYDSGTSGLLAAAITNSIGARTTGHLVHMHPGNECQKEAFMAMRFPNEQAARCINVNVYSVLRHYHQNRKNNTNKEIKVEEDAPPESKKARLEDVRKQWEIDNERACEILEKKVDSLIVVAKEHPVNIVKELIEFLDAGRSLVVFNVLREPLQDLFLYLKNTRSDVISIRLSTNFMRKYQVLPDRTHPEILMNSGGYLLTAYKLMK